MNTFYIESAYCLNLVKAAQLVSQCLWCNKHIVIKDIDETLESLGLWDERLLLALEKQTLKYLNLLLDEAQNGALELSLINRDISGKILSEESYIHIDNLNYFFSERGHDLYGYFYDRAIRDMDNLHNEIASAIESQNISQLNKFINQDVNSLKPKKEKVEKVGYDNHKSNKSLMKIIFAMASRKFNYQPGKNNSAAALIKSSVEQCGLAITDKTVKNWLDKAYESLKDDLEQS